MDTQHSGRWRRTGPLLLAALGLVLVLLGWQPAAAPTASLLVAARALDPGTVITAADVEVVRVRGDVSALDVLHDEAQALGRRVRTALTRGSPLTATLLLTGGPLRPGHRLVTVHSDDATNALGIALGDEVDVMALVVDTRAGDGGRLVRLATGTVDSASHDAMALDVDAAAASRVLWAQAFAKSIRVVPRPPGDDVPLPDVDSVGAPGP